MSNYEIMLILDPKSDESKVSEIAKSTFKSKDIKIEKLERTELAYEINKSKTAIYILVNVKASGEEINEFNRKCNITKNIWRQLSINLDTEKGLNRKAKPKRNRRFVNFQNKKSNDSSTFSETKTSNSNEEEIKESKPKKTSTKKDKDATNTLEVKTKKTSTRKSTSKKEISE